jgi:sugar phosphate permease
LSYVFGYQPDGAQIGDPKYDIKLVHPQLVNNYALVSGPAFYFMYSIAGIFMGVLVDKWNRKNLATLMFGAWGLSMIL